MRLALLALPLLLGACTPAVQYRASPPELIRVPVTSYVPIPGEMTRRCEWVKDAPPSQVFSVSAGRRTCLMQYEQQFRAIERVQGRATASPG